MRPMKLSGFTYIEVLLSVALVLVISMTASPFYGNFLLGQEADTTSAELKSSFALARLYSMLGKGDGQWGVAFVNHRIILFQGSSYATRESAFDEVYKVHDLVSVSGFDEMVFSQRTGTPNIEPTITISLYGNSDTPVTHQHVLLVNATGVVDESF